MAQQGCLQDEIILRIVTEVQPAARLHPNRPIGEQFDQLINIFILDPILAEPGSGKDLPQLLNQRPGEDREEAPLLEGLEDPRRETLGVEQC